MIDHTYRVRLWVVLCLIGGALLLWVPQVSSLQSKTTEPVLAVHFLNVGQGDAIYLVSPEGNELLIDGGATPAVLRELMPLRSYFDHTLEVVVASHPDTDHVGGLVDVFERFTVEAIIDTPTSGESAAAAAYAAAAEAEAAQRLTAQAGDVIVFGASTTIHVLAPFTDTIGWESNRASLVLLVQHGNTRFLFTGDAPTGVEDYLVQRYGAQLQSDVLKLGHHGSDTSSSETFLQTVAPRYAVVSAGADNFYGHPHPAVVARAEAAGAAVLSTAEAGTISFFSDGRRVWTE